MTATNIPSAGIYASGSSTNNGIASISLVEVGYDDNVTIAFKPPSTLAVGTMTDTVTVEACYDRACTRQVGNSPQKVSVTYTVTAPDPEKATPTIASLAPATAIAGSTGFSLSVAGGDFAPSSVVLWNGLPCATTYVSPTSISTQISASDIASAGTATVNVTNLSTGGGQSTPADFVISAPGPQLTALSPTNVVVGGPGFTLSVIGTGFDPTAQVYWNGSAKTTSYVSPNQVIAQIAPDDLVAVDTVSIVVTNLDRPLLPSDSLPFGVVTAPLSVTKLSPASVTAGGRSFYATVIGTGFDASSTVRWNGSPRDTTVVSTTELLAQISSADIATPGSVSLTVVNSDVGTGPTAPVAMNVVAPSIDAVALQINPQHSGAVNFANIVASNAMPAASTWQAKLPGPPNYALIAGGKVFVTVTFGSSGGVLFALNAATGAKEWGPIALGAPSAAAYDNGTIFVLSSSVSSESGLISAYNAVSGALLWSGTITSQWFFTGPPTAVNGLAYLSGSGGGGTVYAVDESNGALAWTARVNGEVNGSPSVSADGVYVSYPCETYDFRPLTGEPVWSNFGACVDGNGGTGAVANGLYYSPDDVTGFSGSAFNAETGSLAFNYSASMPPAIGSQMGYFLQGGTLNGIVLSDNTIQWSFSGDGTLASAPILVNDYVFVAGSSGNLYGLDAATGNQIWQISLGAGTTYSTSSSLRFPGLSAGDGLLVVPAGNSVVAFTLSTSP
jgi:outer membrane protein assembly factor BamB